MHYLHWTHVAGDWDPDNGREPSVVLQYTDPDLIPRVRALIGRIQDRVAGEADWGKIGVLQGEDETVEQYYIRFKEIFDQNSGLPTSPIMEH